MKAERRANKNTPSRAVLSILCALYHNYADDFVTYESICSAMCDERTHYCSRATKVQVTRLKQPPRHKDVFSKRSFFFFSKCTIMWGTGLALTSSEPRVSSSANRVDSKTSISNVKNYKYKFLPCARAIPMPANTARIRMTMFGL